MRVDAATDALPLREIQPKGATNYYYKLLYFRGGSPPIGTTEESLRTPGRPLREAGAKIVTAGRSAPVVLL